jgi:hypothetical protein
LKQEKKKKTSLYFIPQKVLKGFKTGLHKDAKANGYRVVLAAPQRNPRMVFFEVMLTTMSVLMAFTPIRTILKWILYQELSVI